MMNVDEALEMVLQRTGAKRAQTVTLPHALGSILAADVASDIDSPPHDKSLVDGYAVRAADVGRTDVDLKVIEEVTAGATPTREVTAGTATRIMTGAPIPKGADAIIMVEQTERVAPVAVAEAAARQPAVVRILAQRVQAGQHIMRRATSLRANEMVLARGTLVRPIEIGLLAEVGQAEVAVTPPPTVAVLSTGNELVMVGDVPAPGQIRNSNGPMLGALVDRAGGRPIDLGIGRDDQTSLTQLVSRGLESDVLVLSGGVSAGVLDLVPGVLASLGVEQVFHKVNLKPGKPVWFGVLPNSSGDHSSCDKLIFGLPGNPVSSLVCFELFVRPAIARLAGKRADQLSTQQARLTSPHHHRGDRPTYFPARLSFVDGQQQVELLAWKGSADLRTLSSANCLAYFPQGERSYQTGDEVSVAMLP